MNTLSREKQSRVIAALTEGCSVRATERLTDVQKKTILKLGVNVGQGCARLLDGLMRDLQCSLIELDEQWAFIQCKQKRVKPEHADTRGDSWLYIALCATSKAVITYAVGKRSVHLTQALAHDLHGRLVNRPQITADGFAPYTTAVPVAFNRAVDFAQLTKVYQATPGNDSATRYSPGSIRGIEKNTVCGKPDEAKISTSYVERFNLSTRMHMRRFTRLTNGFSKKTENHAAAIALHLAFYNFCRIHETLRCTPAMALGITDHPWTIAELIDAALSAPTLPPVYTPPQAPLPLGMTVSKAKRSGGRRTQLTIIRGGRK